MKEFVTDRREPQLSSWRNRMIAALAVWSVGFYAHAADWSQSIGVSTSAVYTDNKNLSESQEDGEISLVLSPNIAIKGEGARANLDVAGSLQLDSRGKGSDSTNPRLRANADAELIKNTFFVDLDSTITQNAIDPYSTVGSDALNDTGNVTTTYTYGISPYIVGRLKGYANLIARFTYDEVEYSKNSLDGSNRKGLNLGVNSGTNFGRFSWGILASQNEIEYDNNNTAEFRSADVNVGYQINRSWQVNASLGKEWNDFSTIQTDFEGDRWNLGFTWTPSPRTSLGLRYGDRFFGQTTSFEFSHKSKRSVLTAQYSQDLTNSRSLRGQDIFPSTDPFGDDIDLFTDETLPVDTLASINDSTIVDKRFDATYTLKGRRTNLTLRAHHSQQTHQDSTRDVEQSSVGVSALRNITGQILANASLSFGTQSQNGGSDADTIKLGLGLFRKLGQNSSVGLNYGFNDRDSDVAGSSYTENRVTASFAANF
ncbi:MAG: TIGR03016 family PEP-CTERM system-associated outer membrane protein [Sedimenticola sp.]